LWKMVLFFFWGNGNLVCGKTIFLSWETEMICMNWHYLWESDFVLGGCNWLQEEENVFWEKEFGF
jgi:hypothetical protein